MTFLTLEELVDLLDGVDFTVHPTAPTRLLSSGEVYVWPSFTAKGCATDAILFEGHEADCLMIMVTQEVYECLSS